MSAQLHHGKLFEICRKGLWLLQWIDSFLLSVRTLCVSTVASSGFGIDHCPWISCLKSIYSIRRLFRQPIPSNP